MFIEVEGFEAYRVSEAGEVETCWQRGPFYPGMPSEKKWKLLALSSNGDGYMRVELRGANNKRRKVYIHRLVAETFISPSPFKKACVRHLDGDKKNNHVNNLAWGTYVDNENDKIAHGTYGPRTSAAKLTPETINIARRMSEQGFSAGKIAKDLGVSRPTISRMLAGVTWSKT